MVKMVSRLIPDSIKYGQVVAKATSDDEVPCPGYLQEELKKLTFDMDACSVIEDQLLARLEKKSSNVKLKSLRIIKLLCDAGSPSFKRDMQRRTTAIRECLHWRGDPHPTMGDLPSQMVRETAQQVITAVFDTETQPSRSNPPPPTATAAAPRPAPTTSSEAVMGLNGMPTYAEAKRYEGFGSDTSRSTDDGHRSLNSYFSHHVQQNAMPQGSNSKLAGFGTVSKDQSSLGMVKGAATALSSGFTQFKDKITSTKPAGGDSYDSTGGRGQGGLHGGGSYTGGPPVVGNMVQDMQREPQAPSSSSVLSHQSSSFDAQALGRPVSSLVEPQVEPVRPAVGAYEESVVQALTAPGGLRAAPPKEELKDLVNKCPSLDMPLLVALLCSKLEADAWQSRLKTLHVLDALLKAENSEVKMRVHQLLQHRVALVESLSSNSQAALADMSLKVLKEMKSISSESSHQPTVNTNASNDLLDLGLHQPSAPASLFAGLTIASDPNGKPAGTGSQAQVASLDSLFAMSHENGKAELAPSNQTTDDLLQGIFSSNAPAKPPQDPLSDLLGMSAVGPSTEHKTQPAASGFDFLNPPSSQGPAGGLPVVMPMVGQGGQADIGLNSVLSSLESDFFAPQLAHEKQPQDKGTAKQAESDHFSFISTNR
uniref:ENTH domain-containing protein n=1 Tax=Hanusia phi TaxID=3032 RepID=A0A7S0E453_9CRYP